MALDKSVIGWRNEPYAADVERGRLRFFAQATGQTDPVHLDVDAARSAGHPDLVVPLTFLLCLNSERPDARQLYTELGIDQRRVLHGEQVFAYDRLAHAGERLQFVTEVTDVYDKKGGTMDFLVRTTTVTRGAETVARLTATTIIRQRG
ncbi:MaoC family dehydratase N-terminal domain-containing protein [Streptomyces sp. NPDC055078]